MLRRLKLGPRLAVLILASAGLLLLLLLATLHRGARRALESELQDRARQLTAAAVGRTATVLRGSEKLIEGLALGIAAGDRRPAAVYPLLEEALRQNAELFGCAFAPVPASDGAARAVCPYVCRGEGSLLRRDLGQPEYRLETRQWYSAPLATRRSGWSDPYDDDGGGETAMVTYSVPIHDPGDHRVTGVVTGDLSLAWLRELLGSMELRTGGHAFVVSREGEFLAYTRPDLAGQSLVGLAERAGRAEVRALWERMRRGESGFIEFDGLVQPEPMWLAFAPVAGTGWSLATSHPRRELTARLADLAWIAVGVAGAGLVGLCLVSLLIARSIARPVAALEGAAATIATGNLDAPLPAAEGRDEVASLARSFVHMREDLKRHIAELRETTAAQARLERDLGIAQEIQRDLVPHEFETRPPRPEYELHALLDPAREIGGDFYHFALRGTDQLVVAVGDASGKGIPAALYMAQAKTLLVSHARGNASPAQALADVNETLVERNEAAMFLTIFCAQVDLRSGRCVYASGGHPPPFILRQDGTLEVAAKPDGPALGSDGEASFALAELRLKPGDVLVAFSDGILEAESRDGSFFGEERIAATLSGLRGQPPAAIVAALRQAVAEFEAGTPQSDDITILAVRYRG